jgi:flagellar basal body-associated protein FliL
MVERQENMNEQNTINKRTSYQSAIGIAVVAAVFSVVIGAMLAVHVYSMKVHIPARSAELEKMKEQAKANPTDQTLADLILETDTQLRRDQFAGLYFVRRGTILLVVTLVLLVGSIIWAVSHHPKEPEVTPQGDLKTHQVRQASLTRTSFTIAVVII